MSQRQIWDEKQRRKDKIFYWAMVYFYLGAASLFIFGMLYLIFTFHNGSSIFIFLFIICISIVIIPVWPLSMKISRYEQNYLDISRYDSLGRYYFKDVYIKRKGHNRIKENSKLVKSLMVSLNSYLEKRTQDNELLFYQLFPGSGGPDLSQMHLIKLNQLEAILMMRMSRPDKDRQEFEFFIGPRKKVNKKKLKVLGEKIVEDVL